jgi:hypothetical protein
VSAYAQLSAQITGHVEHAIFNEERTTMHAAVQVHEEKKAESDKLYVNATKEIAMQKQTIAHLMPYCHDPTKLQRENWNLQHEIRTKQANFALNFVCKGLISRQKLRGERLKCWIAFSQGSGLSQHVFRSRLYNSEY